MSDETPHLKVYVKPGCPWCVAAVGHLKNEGYDFEEIDVITHRDRFAEMQELSGQNFAPTMSCGDLVLADFGVPELEAFLEEHDIRP